MPRGAKRDNTVTANLFEAGLLNDPGSFVSLTGHLFLEGADKSRVRHFVFRRCRDHCVICNHKLDEEAKFFQDHCGDWHHVKTCDCVGCSELRCDVTTGRKCHAHRTVGFQREANSDEERAS